MHGYEFTAHNILLEDGTQTFPEAGYVMSQHPSFLAAKRSLSVAFPAGLKGVRLVDLGCLEGGYSVEFARLGMDVLGIEARESNFRNCMMMKDRVDLRNLEFVRDDVLNLEAYGKFDAVLCFGILYHLRNPVSFIGLMGNVCKKLLLINTHFAPEQDSSKFQLSDLTEHEGAQGRWYVEFQNPESDDREKSKWASWTNNESFWLRREFLVQAISAAGFPLVFEQYDGLAPNVAHEMISGSYGKLHRSTFVGWKI